MSALPVVVCVNDRGVGVEYRQLVADGFGGSCEVLAGYDETHPRGHLLPSPYGPLTDSTTTATAA